MIKITVGDSISLQLVAKGSGSISYDLTGAVMETKFLDNQGNEIIIPNSAHHIFQNQAGADKGKFTLDLASAQSQNLNVGSGQTIITKATQGTNVMHFRGNGILTVYSDKLSD